MTRSHKANDIPHNHPEAVAAFDEHKIPKYFGKTGFVDMAPNKTKKNGGGKGNWYVINALCDLSLSCNTPYYNTKWFPLTIHSFPTIHPPPKLY
jgi:hypothetical protein